MIHVFQGVFLRPKCYSLRIINLDTLEESKKQTAKGVSKHIIKNTFEKDMYKDCLQTGMPRMVSSYHLRSKRHQMYLQQLRKVGLSSFVDKNYALNAVESLPFNDYRIALYESLQPIDLLIEQINDDDDDGDDGALLNFDDYV